MGEPILTDQLLQRRVARYEAEVLVDEGASALASDQSVCELARWYAPCSDAAWSLRIRVNRFKHRLKRLDPYECHMSVAIRDASSRHSTVT